MKQNNTGFTLIEIIMASLTFSLFLGGCFAIYSHSQRTITRGNWLNKSTLEDARTKRILSELTKSSSYPSTVRSNLIKTAEGSDVFKAKLPSGTGEFAAQKNDIIILAFPICKEQTENMPGKIKWVRLRLSSKNSSNGLLDLITDESSEVSYSPGAPNYAEKLNTPGLSQTTFTKSTLLMSDIQKAELSVLPDIVNSLDLAFNLVCPNDKNLKKEIKLTLTLNVEIKK